MDSLEQLEQEMAEQAKQEQEAFIQNYGNELVEDESDKPKRYAWKLVMTRKIATVTFRFSDECECVRQLYQDKEKFTLYRDGSVGLRITLCSKCVPMNIDANEAMGKFSRPWKKNGSKSKDDEAELAALKAEAADGKKEHHKLLLVRRIATIQIRFSDWCKCSKNLFDDKEKITEHNDDSVTVRMKLCGICRHQNIALNELVSKFCEVATKKRK